MQNVTTSLITNSTLEAYLTSVLEDPHEQDSVKDAIQDYRMARQRQFDSFQAREKSWQTYNEQRYNEFQQELVKVKKQCETEVMIADVKTGLTFIGLIVYMLMKS
jgi:hypothetical protein